MEILKLKMKLCLLGLQSFLFTLLIQKMILTKLKIYIHILSLLKLRKFIFIKEKN